MELSIVIPVYLANKELVDMTNSLALESIFRNCDLVNTEVIIIDDCSPLETESSNIVTNYKKKGLNISLIRNETNLGYGQSCNIGVSESKGKYILILNNDIYLPKDSCQKLIKYLNFYNLGMIGPLLSDAHGYKAQETNSPRFINDYSKIPYDDIELFSIKNSELNDEILDVNFLMGSCMLTTRELWDKVNGISSIYGKGYVEEVDMQVRIRRMGYKLGIAKDVFVLHESIKKTGSPSFSLNLIQRKFLLSRNSLIFLLRNGFKENWQLNFDWHKRDQWPNLKINS